MVLLNQIFDIDVLGQHIIDGNISKREHNTLPYVILNYTPQCQFNRNWDDVTRACRGLIYNYETGEVIARPFPKFGNWDEQGYPMPPAGPALRMEKMDGSLGILYSYTHHLGGCFAEDRYAISTRGSMHSEQAEWATEFYNEFVAGQNGVNFRPKRDKTYLFEIIYPENRIVVDYGEYKGLVLLDVIDNATGFSDTDEFDDCAWPEKVVRHPVPGFDSGQAADIPEGEEGFVFLWPVKNFRTKMKSADYIELHRLVSNLSEKSVWKALVDGKTLDQIKIGLPEEFHGFIDTTHDEIMARVFNIMNHVTKTYQDLEEKGLTKDRKTFALAVKSLNMKKYLFLMLDSKPIYPVALFDSKPRTDKALVTGE